MQIVDRILAALGWVAASVARLSAWVPRVAVAALITMSILPVLIIGATPEPSDISFADLEQRRIPAMTTWLRLRGTLEVAVDTRAYTFTYPWTYVLREPGDSRLAVTVVAGAPLEIGTTDITGRVSGAVSYPGTFAAIEADVPTKPGRQDPWLLFGLPALLALGLLVGLRAGYPVTRHDGRRSAQATALDVGETVFGRWSGRIKGEIVPLEQMRPCKLAVATDSDPCELSIIEGSSVRSVTVRRGSTKQRLRICWLRGCSPAVQVYGPSADVVVAFDERIDRDRLAAALE